MAFGTEARYNKSSAVKFFPGNADYIYLLNYLLSQPSRKFYIRITCSETNLKAKTVAYYLKKLVEYKIVIRDGSGWILNQESPVIPALRNLFSTIDALQEQEITCVPTIKHRR